MLGVVMVKDKGCKKLKQIFKNFEFESLINWDSNKNWIFMFFKLPIHFFLNMASIWSNLKNCQKKVPNIWKDKIKNFWLIFIAILI